MEKSKVYFTNMRALPGTNLLEKLDKLMIKAGIGDINFENRFVAIKLHFGEPGNLSYLRPNFSKVVADRVKALGGIPFLTDSNTMYVGMRKNAIDHLNAAYENGYNPFATGCQVIIADGLKGTDDRIVKIEGGEDLKEAYIGSAIVDADIIISLNHFKGHELTGFGGAVKNIGMGSGSRAGKMAMHKEGKPSVTKEKCVGCHICAKNCAHGAITFEEDKKATINHDKCVGCSRCVGTCNFNAIYNKNSGANDGLNRKMAEYCKAVIDGKPNFHISIINQVSPYCDCHGENDTAIIPDVGIMASFDPVALDVACADACNKMPIIKDSMLGEADIDHNHDHFHNLHPTTNWMSCMDHAEKIGVGSKEYELILLDEAPWEK